MNCRLFVLIFIFFTPLFVRGQVNITTINVDNESCVGSCNGALTVNTSGGIGPVEYNIGGASQSSNVFSGLCAGTYTVVAVDSALNSDTAIVNISSNPDVSTIIVSQYNNPCFGDCIGSLALLSTGGSTFYEVSGPFSGSPTSYTSVTVLNGFCAGTDTLLITDVLTGCTTNLIATITEPAAISITLLDTNETSAGSCDGSITVSVTGGTGSMMFSMDGGTTYQSSPSFFGVCNGAYAVCVKDANNCLACTTAYIGTGACPMISSITAITNALCNGTCSGTATLNSMFGTAPYSFMNPTTFSINTYSSSFLITGLCAGTYSVVINDDVGCANMVTFTINQPTPLVISSTSSTDESFLGACDGTISLTGGGGTMPYMYTSACFTSPFDTSSNFVGLCAATYPIGIMDSNGCTVCSGAITIGTATCTMNASIGTFVNASCSYSYNGNVQLLTSGGVGPYSTQHPITGTTINYTSSTNISGLCAGTYTLVVSDGTSGCTDTVTFTINSPPVLNAGITGITNASAVAACDGSMSNSSSGGSAPYSFNWIDCSTMTSIGQTSFTAINLCEGYYALIVTDINGCKDTSMCDSILDPPLGIFETNRQNNFSVFPNPARSVVTVNTRNAKDLWLILRDFYGRLIYASNFISTKSMDLSLMNIESGSYILTVYDGGEILHNEKLIVLK